MLNRYGVVLVILMMTLTLSVFGQYRAEKLGGGAAVGGTVGFTGEDETGWDNEGGLHFRVFLRHSLNSMLEVEAGASVGADLVDEAYTTNLLPIDVRLLIRLMETRSFSPYLFGGVGMVRHHVDELPANVSADFENDAWNPFVPLGLGIQFRINDNTSFELQGAANVTLTDDLNAMDLSDGNDMFFYATAGLTMAGRDGNADPDMDGLTNAQEAELGTDPNVADTDGDGLNDGEEFNTYSSDPKNPDTDGDGLTDKEEAKDHKTDPTKADTDGDGLSDKDELMTHKTDPTKADMDNDGLSDKEELMTTMTEVANADTDGDGLKDGEEVNTYKTDPKNSDSDGGSVDDGREVNRGTNPNKAEDDVIIEVKEDAPIVLEGIVFATGSATISPESEDILTKVVNTMKAYPNMVVEIRGYTDNTGSRNGNMGLSQRRADSVRNYMVEKGVEGERVSAKGFGPDNPIAPNSTPEGRQKNRRIEFVPLVGSPGNHQGGIRRNVPSWMRFRRYG